MRKKLFFFIVFICAAAFMMTACSALQEKKEVQAWDFGSVKEGAVYTHDFVFKNGSVKKLTIKQVDTSCGCTSSQVEKKILAPNEETLIKVQFDSAGYSGPVKQHVYVQTDDANNPVMQYAISANVVKK